MSVWAMISSKQYVHENQACRIEAVTMSKSNSQNFKIQVVKERVHRRRQRRQET